MHSITNSLLDSGANVTLVPLEFMKKFNIDMKPHTDGRRIGTADKEGALEILGWIDLEGYIGLAAVCNQISFIIIAINQLKKRGLGVDFKCNTSDCLLYTKHGLFSKVEECPHTKLYFIDIRLLMGKYVIPFLSQEGDIKPANNGLLGGSAGHVNIVMPSVVIPPTRSRKRKPTFDMLFRVWSLHRRMKHIPLYTISRMTKDGLLIDSDVEAWEIDLVAAHQDCFACALAKWKQQNEKPGSGIRPSKVGTGWSADYQGPYNVPAIGGFNGKITFICLTCGYGVVFLVKSKTEMFACVVKINILCNRYGHQFRFLRVDAGSVENSEEFLT